MANGSLAMKVPLIYSLTKNRDNTSFPRLGRTPVKSSAANSRMNSEDLFVMLRACVGLGKYPNRGDTGYEVIGLLHHRAIAKCRAS